MLNIKVIIITLNYNQNDYTLKCIDSILESDFEKFKILLIDNGSELKVYNELEKSLSKDNRVILHRIEQNKGYVGGINYGLEQGAILNPDYFLIMNNDTVLDKNVIKELASTCKNYNNNAIVTGKVYHYDEPNKLQDVGYTFTNVNFLSLKRLGLNEVDIGQYDKTEERDLIDDVIWLFPSSLYKEIGGYCPYYWFNFEQADFALQAKRKGYKLIFCPLAKLWHKGSVSVGGRNQNPKYAYWSNQSMLIYKYRNLSNKYFAITYFKFVISIMISYCQMTTYYFLNRRYSFQYAHAKLLSLIYFHKWLYKRNYNTGKNPF